MSGLLRCPVCAGPLQGEEKSLKCTRGHSFDFASSGYVSLLTGGKKGAAPGDSKEMCASRNRFLSRGYYECLACGIAGELTQRAAAVPAPVLVDAACGEGYYTAAMHAALCAGGRRAQTVGVDLSKFALKYAAKRCPAIQFAAASIFSLPLADGCADAITNIFAPVAAAEFLRVLRPGGLLLIVGPGPRHLWGLKQFLYEKPYLNEPNHYELPGFTPLEIRRIESTAVLTCGQDILDLFAMTPYFWKTPREAAERLHTLATLTTELSFELHFYRKGC